MSNVEQIEAAMSNLTVDELQEIRGWLENFLEDELELTDDFKAQIGQAERDMAEGRYSRIRRLGLNIAREIDPFHIVSIDDIWSQQQA